MHNALFIVNYNSTDQCLNLLRESNLSILEIGNIFILNNGVALSEVQRCSLLDAANLKNCKLSIIDLENRGYGAAINSAIRKLKQDQNPFDYCFFSNADLVIHPGTSSFHYLGFDSVGFPLFEDGKFVISKVNIFTPLIPFRIRKYFSGLKIKTGCSHGVHGCFFGLSARLINDRDVFFNESYFLYWEETRFFYELSKSSINSFVSDVAFIHHDGKKSVISEDARYYLLRNGLNFYAECVESKLLARVWYLLNFIYALALPKDLLQLKLPRWYTQALLDFKNATYGRRQED
jgi:GT2 family glycosyltransferase